MTITAPPLSDRVHLAFCCDAGYVRPLAAAIVSVLATARRPSRLHFWLITDAPSAPALAPVVTMLESRGATCDLIAASDDALVDPNLPISEHFTRATYYRLRLPDLLPQCVRRLIYLDCDLVVRQPIEELWATPLGTASTAAVLNPRAFHFAELGLRSESDYFNAGVLLLDLDAWRNDDLHGRALAFIAAQTTALRCVDQDALNHVIAGRWRPLDLRWNQQLKFFQHPAYFLHVDRHELRSARRDPFLIHYTTNSKPWHYDNDHPWRRLFFEFLDQTPYRDWRPAAPVALRDRLRRRAHALIPHPLRSPFWRYNIPPPLSALKHRLVPS